MLILLYSCFMLRPPMIKINNDCLRWILEYTELYGKYKHAVMSWRLVFIIGAIISLLAIFIESGTRRIQGYNSMAFHICMAFLVAVVSFWAFNQIHFARVSLVPLPDFMERYDAMRYDVITSALKSALAYTLLSYGASATIMRIGRRNELRK